MAKRLLISVVLSLGMVVSTPSATLASTVFTTYSTASSTATGKPYRLVSAAGSLWYGEAATTGSLYVQSIGNMTTSGTVVADHSVITQPGLANFSIRSIATGADNNVWFVGTVSTTPKVGSLNTATGVVTYYSVPSSLGWSGLTDLVTDPNGNLWFAVKGAGGAMASTYVAKIDTSAGVVTVEKTISDYYAAVSKLAGITSSGGLWYKDSYYNKVECINLSPSACPPSSSIPTGIQTFGISLNGNFLFVKSGKITEITSTGATTEYTLPTGITYAGDFIPGNDNALWFRASGATTNIGRLAANGQISIYPLPTGITNVTGFAWGPDNTPWVSTDTGSGQLVRMGYYQ